MRWFFLALALGACSGSAATDDGAAGDTDFFGDSDAAGDSSTTGGDSASAAMRVFVTSTGYDGDLRDAGNGADGLEGADNLCQLAADGALLGGTWKAWVSTLDANAIDRIADVGPWQDLQGTLVFNNAANLATTPLAPLYIDERGNEVVAETVWTGTEAGGRVALSRCEEWTTDFQSESGRAGIVGATDGSWTNDDLYDCGAPRRLYCLEQ